MKRGRSRELLEVIPWLLAALVWFGLVGPMRADQEDRLARQGRVRRERMKADRAMRDAQALLARVGASLGKACRASADPAALRQRTVAATQNLALSPVTLSVTGGPGGGASADGEGTKAAVLELLRRFGDPNRGSFLRTVTLRDRGARFAMSATTGVLESFPAGITPVPPQCAGAPDPGPAVDEQTLSRPRPVAVRSSASPGPDLSAAPSPAPTPAPPFTLVAFLTTEGKRRVSIRAGAGVRVVAVGDQVDGWRCVSIDRDEGAVFVSASGERLVLNASPEER